MQYHEIVWGETPTSELLQQGISPEGIPLLPTAEELEINRHQLAEWIRAALRAMAGKDVHMVALQLGDAPDILACEGYNLVEAQASADAILEQIAEDEWEWMDDEDIINFEAIEDLGYHKVNELPHPPYDFDAEDDDGGVDAGLPYEDREGIWALLVLTTLREIVKDQNLSQILTQGQTAVPIFVGFEDAPELVAVLTPKGFQKPFA